MSLPFDVPVWMPWWVPLVLLVPTLLWILAFLLVPFSVIGLKSRMDGLEARLDEIHAEIRTLSLRLPEAGQAVDFDELYTAPEPVEPPRRPSPAMTRPPIPPAPHELEAEEPRETSAPAKPPAPTRRPEGAPRRDGRMEPRLDWPR
jgi:hypothetical protein